MTKGKIAVLTQPLGKNYGGLIQAWALQQVLVQAGFDAIVVDRQWSRRGRLFNFARYFARFLFRMQGKWRGPLNIESYYDDFYAKSNQFIRENIKITEPIFSSIALEKHFINQEYSAVIVGSDQTWRPSYSPNIFNFFLDFVNSSRIKKISYASSFGVDHWEYTDDQTKKCSSLVQQFNNVSVREKSGVELCKKYLKVNAQFVLDPTLLLEKEYYFSLIQERRRRNLSGVFTYILDSDNDVAALAERISAQLGEPLASCQAKCNPRNPVSTKLDDYYMPDVRDWLAGFANARFVVTDSFHGMVFALIFEKPFVAIINEGRGSARFLSIADCFGVRNRVIRKNDISNITDVKKFFRIPAVDKSEMQKKSLDFLFESLELQ